MISRNLLKYCLLASILAPECRSLAQAQTNALGPVIQPVTAREFYNTGTELLAAKKFGEAEEMFLSALAAQDEQARQPSLYNLAQARFDDGLAALKKGPSSSSGVAQGGQAAFEAGSAIERGESALASDDLSKLIEAYVAGLGARHDLRSAAAAVRQAMERYGETLRKWRQADDDFKSAAELNPADENAARNAKIVEQYIARLVDSLRQMQRMAAMLGARRQRLDHVLRQIGGRIPKPDLPPGAPGDQDEDEGLQPESLRGLKEGATRMGNPMKMPLSRDQAAQILNGIPLDGAQRLMMNESKTGRPAQNSGLTW